MRTGRVNGPDTEGLDDEGICQCVDARPENSWGYQCTRCWHPIPALHPVIAEALA